MAILLNTRAELVRAFYNLTGSSASDAALTEHDASPGDQLHYYLTMGAWAAQRYMIGHGWADWWLKTSAALVFADDGEEQYAALPDDFLMLAGDGTRSSLLGADGRNYGTLVAESADPLTGVLNYALRNDRIYFGSGEVPAVTLRYHYRHPEFDAAADAVDFPAEHRALVVAEAADLAAKDSWLPGGTEMEARISRAVQAAQARAAGATRSRAPRTFNGPAAYNGSWLS